VRRADLRVLAMIEFDLKPELVDLRADYFAAKPSSDKSLSTTQTKKGNGRGKAKGKKAGNKGSKRGSKVPRGDALRRLVETLPVSPFEGTIIEMSAAVAEGSSAAAPEELPEKLSVTLNMELIRKSMKQKRQATRRT